MPRKKPSRVTFLDAHVSASGWLGVLAFPEDYSGDVEFTMFFTTQNDQWAQLQFDFDIVSVSSLVDEGSNYRAWWLAGKRGELVEVRGGSARIERIPTAGTGSPGKYGYLAQLRTIGGKLFLCGYRRQVYVRESGNWLAIGTQILDNKTNGPWTGFESIDGFSTRDIYAAGDGGEVWHYDGTTWDQCDVPTNRNISEVRCIGDEVWLCGDGGFVIRGRNDQWDVVWDSDDPSENWWSIEKFQDQIYLAGNELLVVLDKGKVTPLSIPRKPDITTHRLQAANGKLWSIGEDDIFQFDGSKWASVVCPQNR